MLTAAQAAIKTAPALKIMAAVIMIAAHSAVTAEGRIKLSLGPKQPLPYRTNPECTGLLMLLVKFCI